MSKTYLNIVSLFLHGAGIGLVIHFAGWQVGIGLFLWTWGNNLSHLLRNK